MAVITISREFGSDGMDIAKGIARRSWDISSSTNRRSEICSDNMASSNSARCMIPCRLSGKASIPRKWNSEKITIDMMNRTILALGNHGKAVIVGRGSYLALAGFDDALNVRIQAPLAARVARIMKDRNLGDKAQAEAFVKENDAKREHFIESAYGSHRDRARDFDLVIDTNKVPSDRAIALIVDVAKNLESISGANSKLASAADVDPVLKGVVDKLFARR